MRSWNEPTPRVVNIQVLNSTKWLLTKQWWALLVVEGTAVRIGGAGEAGVDFGKVKIYDLQICSIHIPLKHAHAPSIHYSC